MIYFSPDQIQGFLGSTPGPLIWVRPLEVWFQLGLKTLDLNQDGNKQKPQIWLGRCTPQPDIECGTIWKLQIGK